MDNLSCLNMVEQVLNIENLYEVLDVLDANPDQYDNFNAEDIDGNLSTCSILFTTHSPEIINQNGDRSLQFLILHPYLIYDIAKRCVNMTQYGNMSPSETSFIFNMENSINRINDLINDSLQLIRQSRTLEIYSYIDDIFIFLLMFYTCGQQVNLKRDENGNASYYVIDNPSSLLVDDLIKKYKINDNPNSFVVGIRQLLDEIVLYEKQKNSIILSLPMVII